MAMTRTEWNALQAKLPSEDRMSYDEYRMALSATNKATSTPASPASFRKAEEAQQQAALVAQVVAAAIVNTPVVVDTIKNEAPVRSEVENIAREIAAAIVPVIAPSLTPEVVESVVKETTKAVVTNPEVKASDINQTVTPEVVSQIAQTAVASIGGSADAAYDIKTGTVSTTPTQASGAGESGTIGATRLEAQMKPATDAKATSEAPANAAPFSPSTLAAQESGAIGAASIEAQIQNNQDNGTKTNTSPIKGPGDIRKFDETGTGFTAPTGPTGTLTGPTGPTGTLTGPTGTLTGPVAPKVYTASDGTEFTDQAAFVKYEEILSSQSADKASAAAQLRIDEENKRLGRKSAYDLLLEQFQQYGLGGLVEPLKGLIMDPTISESEFTLKLRDTDAYKDRFAANKQRIGKGLSALSEAEYIALEDQYQNVMRQYGLPGSYYEETSTPFGIKKQAGFEKFLAGDISPAELEDRIMTAQDRVLKANPEVTAALKQFYPDITNGDILAYTLDPKNAVKDIQRKVTAAEIGGAALAQNLTTNLPRAEQLAGAGVTKQQAQQGFETVAGMAPRGGQLASIYKEDPYTQQTAETEVFGLAGSAQAKKKREKLTALETASFSGQSGRGVLARERAGTI